MRTIKNHSLISSSGKNINLRELKKPLKKGTRMRSQSYFEKFYMCRKVIIYNMFSRMSSLHHFIQVSNKGKSDCIFNL